MIQHSALEPRGFTDPKVARGPHAVAPHRLDDQAQRTDFVSRDDVVVPRVVDKRQAADPVPRDDGVAPRVVDKRQASDPIARDDDEVPRVVDKRQAADPSPRTGGASARAVNKNPVGGGRTGQESAGSAVPTAAALGLGAAGGLGLGVAAHEFTSPGGVRQPDFASPVGHDGPRLPDFNPRHGGVADRDFTRSPSFDGHNGEASSGSGDGGSASAADSSDTPAQVFDSDRLLSRDEFLSNSGISSKNVLGDLEDPSSTSDEAQPQDPRDSGLPQESEAEPANDAALQAQSDQESAAAEARQRQNDEEILSHEAQADHGKQIAEQAKADMDAAEDGDGGGGNAAPSTRAVLRINGATLETLQTTSRTVADNFDKDGIKAAKNRDREAVQGYPSLSGAIKSFYDNWSAKRGNIVKEVQKYSEWMQQISEGFESTDRDLAGSLVESGSFENDLYQQIRDDRAKQASKQEDTSQNDPHNAPAEEPDPGSFARQHTEVRGAAGASAESTASILRSIERIDTEGAYAQYVADFLRSATGFGSVSSSLAGNVGIDAVEAEAIDSLADLIAYARDTGQLPAELGFLSLPAVSALAAPISESARPDGEDHDTTEKEAGR